MLNVLFYFCFSAMVVGSLPLWWKVFQRRKSAQGLMELREQSGTPLGMIDVIVMFLIWVSAQLVTIGLIQLAFGLGSDELATSAGDTQSWIVISLAGGQLVACAAALAFFLIRYGSLAAIGLHWKTAGSDLKIGLKSFVMVIPAVLFLQWALVQILAYKHPTMEMLAENANGLTLMAAWASAVVAAPIFEEVFFRGVLQGWLQRVGPGIADRVLLGGWDSQSEQAATLDAANDPTGANAGDQQDSESIEAKSSNSSDDNPYSAPRKFGPAYRLLGGETDESHVSDSWWPIVLTSLLFALAHVGQGPAPIPLFFFGLVLGYIFRRTNSILPCIVLHMMLNAFSMFWFTLGVFWGDSKAAEIVPAGRCFELIQIVFS